MDFDNKTLLFCLIYKKMYIESVVKLIMWNNFYFEINIFVYGY